MWRTCLAAHDMWNLPGPGIEPVSSALAGGFLTMRPPGKSPSLSFKETLSPEIPGNIVKQDGLSSPVSIAFFFPTLTPRDQGALPLSL